MNTTYTIITGASQGLGKELAIECAKQGRNLILVSLQNEGLLRLQKKLIFEYSVQVEIYETNLTIKENVIELTNWVNSNFKIDTLINNAGIGGSMSFFKASETYIENIIALNVNALVLLTKKLLKNLNQNAQAHILNIASMASFSPMPFKTVYPASKAFVSSFSRGLNSELKNTNISISVAYPGGMATNPEVSKRINEHSKIIRNTTVSVEKVAQICIKLMIKRKTLIIPGFINKLSWFVFKICPERLLLKLFRNGVQKEINVKDISYV